MSTEYGLQLVFFLLFSHALPRASAKENKIMDPIGFFLSCEVACWLQYSRGKGLSESFVPNARISFLSSVSNSFNFPVRFLQSKQALIGQRRRINDGPSFKGMYMEFKGRYITTCQLSRMLSYAVSRRIFAYAEER